MSTTPTLETLHARMQDHIDDVLRMCADIQANLEEQQAMLARLRRVLEARNARAVARCAEQAGNSHAVQFPAA